MSHWTTVQTTQSLDDIGCLKEALRMMGYKNIKTDSSCRGYSGSRKADLVVKDAGNGYDIGFVLGAGKTEIIGDFDMLGLSHETFQNLVTQKYVHTKVLKELRMRGMNNVRTSENDGKIELTVDLAGTRFV